MPDPRRSRTCIASSRSASGLNPDASATTTWARPTVTAPAAMLAANCAVLGLERLDAFLLRAVRATSAPAAAPTSPGRTRRWSAAIDSWRRRPVRYSYAKGAGKSLGASQVRSNR